MTRASLAVGRATPGAPTETDIIVRTMPFTKPVTTDGVLFFHGSGETARTTYAQTLVRAMLEDIGQTSVVIMADFGLQAWANNTAVARAVEAMNYGEANLGVTGKWTLVGGSMGNANAFATAKANPTRVKGIAGIIPLMSIPDIMAKGVTAEVNAAYGGTYVDATDGPTHSPISMAMDPLLPIHLWCAPDDALVPITIAEAFVATRPQTKLTVLPNGGHSVASIGNAAAAVAAWVRNLAP